MLFYYTCVDCNNELTSRVYGWLVRYDFEAWATFFFKKKKENWKISFDPIRCIYLIEISFWSFAKPCIHYAVDYRVLFYKVIHCTYGWKLSTFCKDKSNMFIHFYEKSFPRRIYISLYEYLVDEIAWAHLVVFHTRYRSIYLFDTVFNILKDIKFFFIIYFHFNSESCRTEKKNECYKN